MEYALGSMITLLTVACINIFLSKRPIQMPPKIKYSQSHVYNLLEPFIPDNDDLAEPTVSQSTKHYESIAMRIVFMENKAYWIQDNTFYVADAQNGQILTDTTTEVDTMSMDRVQLDKIKFVVEKLTEGSTNDSRNAG